MADCANASLTKIPKSLPKDTNWLILSRNNISSFQVTILQRLYDLSRLDLQNNKIKYISEEFLKYLKTQSNLVDLDISSNELKSIPRNFIPTILKALRLSGNRFECTCNNIWMKKWLTDRREVVQDYKTVDCQMESGKHIRFIELTYDDLACASMFTVELELVFPKHNTIICI